MKSTLTSKGQITLPAELRRNLKLEKGDKVHFVPLEDGSARMVRVSRRLSELKSVLPRPKKRLSLEAMDAVIRRRAGK